MNRADFDSEMVRLKSILARDVHFPAEDDAALADLELVVMKLLKTRAAWTHTALLDPLLRRPR